jgi:hypothetical protein
LRRFISHIEKSSFMLEALRALRLIIIILWLYHRMAHHAEAHTAKISPEVSARLARLKPQYKIRALVMLHVDFSGEAPSRRQSRAERQAMIERLRQSSEPVLTAIDDILAHYSGARLAASVNALGAVPAETTAVGIHALAASDHAKAILEDQVVSILSVPRYP